MRDIEDALPFVMVYAPRAPEPLAIRSIRASAQKLCKLARFWRERDTFKVSYPESQGICTIPDAKIIGIEAASIDDQPLEPVTVGWLDEHRLGWDSYNRQESSPRFITQLTPDTVTISPKATGTVSARFVLMPSLQALSLPDFLIEEHGDAIGKGAAGLVLTTPDAAFANPHLGAALLTGFDNFCSGQRFTAAKGKQGGRLRTKGAYL